ncbi:hypothetical protein JL107_14600 [Nakamurella flavida]|uniref:ANTAR domain-containing protein n=1 Tax=Nakamurella flavida TaxID=363630 RepID=A0A938YMZ2_9ACTN|nr:hypothetical protein [Nakamurella flavida]MBM9477678.1 hypothetical protein [Nakamurella flavida]MDP9779230.1 hypothetical protein [Nakamurella flavida]
MDVVDAFRAAADSAIDRHPQWGDPALLATRLSWAIAAVLHSDGAGLSLSSGDGLRVPLGSSSEPAALAERLQFTTGEGPCLEAETTADPIMATEAVMTHTWPIFAGRLLIETPFRSIFSAPVAGVGTMDVYFTGPAGCLTVPVGDAVLVAEQVSAALSDPRHVRTIENEVTTGDAGGRHLVNIAMGMLTQARSISFPDALAALRAHAFAADLTLEQLADAVVAGTVPVGDLLP